MRLDGRQVYFLTGTYIARSPAQMPSVKPQTQAGKLISSASSQVGITLIYDPAYRRLEYPMGDIPRERGVCTDVVVRKI